MERYEVWRYQWEWVKEVGSGFHCKGGESVFCWLVEVPAVPLGSEFVILGGGWFARQQVIQRGTPLHCVWKREGADGGALEHRQVARAADSGKRAACTGI